MFSTSCFERPFQSRAYAALFLLAIGLPGLLFVAETVRIGISATATESNSISQLHTALSFDPANAGLHHQLGVLYSYAWEELNAAEALKRFRRATQLNPYEPFYWADLASACEATGDTVCADQGFERALSRSPMTPRLYWVAANHYLLTGRPQLALAQFRRLLQLAPGYAQPTFDLCLRAVAPEAVYRELLPPDSDPKLELAFVNFLSAHAQPALAYRVWNRVVAKGSSFSFGLAEPYLDTLISLGRREEAATVWQELQRLRVVQRPPGDQSGNLIFNGSFEQQPLNAGFDWRYGIPPYLFLDFSDPMAYAGHRCLRIDFTVKRNEDYEPVYQMVTLLPRREYRLTAYTRSENITSDSGPRLRVLDPVCPSCLDVSTETTVGSTGWHPTTLTFMIRPETHLVRVSIWRPHSRTFPMEITGRFWLDAVSLYPLH